MSSSTRRTRKRLAAGTFAGLLGVSGVAALAPAASAKDFAQVINTTASLSGANVGGAARLSGVNRYATAAAVATATYGTSGGKSDIILASGSNFPDGLAAAGLAGALDSPVLLTDPLTLPTETASVLATLTAGNAAKRVHVIGGLSAVSQAVRDQLKALGYTLVETYSGANRADTSAKVAAAITAPAIGGIGGKRTAILATGAAYADALSAGSVAFAGKFPILLTDTATLSPETSAALTSLAITQVIIMGGTAAVSQTVRDALTAKGITLVAISGADRADTAGKLATYADTNLAGLGYGMTSVVLFNGFTTFADGLSAGPHAGKIHANLLPVDAASVPAATTAYITAIQPTLTVVQGVGGTAVIADTTLAAAVTSATITGITATIVANAGSQFATVTFSAPVAAATVIAANFQVASTTGTTVASAVATDGSNTKFLIGFSAPLAPGDVVSTTANLTTAGLSRITNPVGTTFVLATSTTVAADVTKPAAIVAASTGSSAFTVTFTEQVLGLPTVTVTRPAGSPALTITAPVAGTCTGAAQAVTTCSYTTSVPLVTGDVINVSGYTDLATPTNAGNAVAFNVAPDAVKPSVVSASVTSSNTATASLGIAGDTTTAGNGLSLLAKTAGSSGNANSIVIAAPGTTGLITVTTAANLLGGLTITVTPAAGGSTASAIASAITANTAAAAVVNVAGGTDLFTAAHANAFLVNGVTTGRVTVQYSEGVTTAGTVQVDITGDGIADYTLDNTKLAAAPSTVLAAGRAVWLVQSGGTVPGTSQSVPAVPISGLSKLQVSGTQDLATPANTITAQIIAVA